MEDNKKMNEIIKPAFDFTKDSSSLTVIQKEEQCNLLKTVYKKKLANISLRYGNPGPYLKSRHFSFKTNRNIEWQMELKENDSHENYVSLYLHLRRSNIPKLQVFFVCHLKKIPQETIRSVKTMFFLGTAQGQGKSMCIPKFVTKKSLPMMTLNEFSVNCKIYALPSLVIDMDKQYLVNDLGLLLKEEKFTDVTLIASNKELRAHKAILAARSPVFAKMFEHEMREKKESRVRIEDIDYEVLRSFLRFAYTSQLEGSCEAMAGALLTAAEKYQFDELKNASATLLLRRLTVANAIGTLELVDRFNIADFKAKVIDFINSHAKQIVKTPAFKSLSETQAHLIAEIYSVMAQAVTDSAENSNHTSKRIRKIVRVGGVTYDL